MPDGAIDQHRHEDGTIRICLRQGEAEVCCTVSSEHLAVEKEKQLREAMGRKEVSSESP